MTCYKRAISIRNLPQRVIYRNIRSERNILHPHMFARNAQSFFLGRMMLWCICAADPKTGCLADSRAELACHRVMYAQFMESYCSTATKSSVIKEAMEPVYSKCVKEKGGYILRFAQETTKPRRSRLASAYKHCHD